MKLVSDQGPNEELHVGFCLQGDVGCIPQQQSIRNDDDSQLCRRSFP